MYETTKAIRAVHLAVHCRHVATGQRITASMWLQREQFGFDALLASEMRDIGDEVWVVFPGGVQSTMRDGSTVNLDRTHIRHFLSESMRECFGTSPNVRVDVGLREDVDKLLGPEFVLEHLIRRSPRSRIGDN